jgi:hypothetical protein
MSLAELRDEVVDLLEDELTVVAGGASVVELGGVLERISVLFQALGVADLLLFADRDRYRKNLVLSGYARRYHLRRSRDESATSEYRAISRSPAFFDALVARHDALAAEIVERSSTQWIPAGEYEEDYCYYQFLHYFAASPRDADRAGLQALLDRAGAVLGGVEDPRIEICRAFYDADEASFLQAFDELLHAQERWATENEVRLAHDPAFQLRSRLFVEGLALLDLAQSVGFDVEPEYRYCPSLARLSPSSLWPPDLFVEVDRIAREERAERANQPDD